MTLTKEEREAEEQRLAALEAMVRESRAKLGIDGPSPVEQQLQQLNATVATVAQRVQPAAPSIGTGPDDPPYRP